MTRRDSFHLAGEKQGNLLESLLPLQSHLTKADALEISEKQLRNKRETNGKLQLRGETFLRNEKKLRNT